MLSSQLVPNADRSRLPCSVHIDDPLVPAAPELQRDILQFLHKPSVHQHVDAREHLIRCFAPGIAAVCPQLIVPPEPGTAPYGLARILRLDLPQQRQQLPLVPRLERLAAQLRQSVSKGLVQLREYLRLGVLREILYVVKIPRLGLKAIFAVVGAAGHKQRHPDPDAVGNITFFQIAIVHDIAPFG